MSDKDLFKKLFQKNGLTANDIHNKILNKIENKYNVRKRYSFNKIIYIPIFALIIVVSILFVNNYERIFQSSNIIDDYSVSTKTISINNIDYNGNYNDVINILIPKENQNKFLDYDWKYISENIDIIKENYDISLVFKIPDELTDVESTCLYNKYKEEIVECGIKYYKKTNESQTTNSILISVAKNEYPFRGNNFPKEGNENISISKIDETSIIILHSKIRMLYTESPQNYDFYVSRFKKDNIYYDIETIGISQKELISTLESIVDRN